MRTAYSYIRFSSQEQKKGESLKRQTIWRNEFIAKKGWNLDQQLVLQDLGKSAFKSGKQNGLQLFLDAIKSGAVASGSVLVVEHLDRLSRQEPMDAMVLLYSIVKAGVDVATIEPERVYTVDGLKDLTGLLEPVLHFCSSYAESAKKSERANFNWNEKRAAIKEGKIVSKKCPMWLDIIYENGKPIKYVVNKPKALIVKRIFNMCCDGLGNRSIAKQLNNEGIQNIAFGWRSDSKEIWNSVTVNNILKNIAVIGTFESDKQSKIVDYYPAILDKATFFKSLDISKGRTNTRGRAGIECANIFSGVLFPKEKGKSIRVQAHASGRRFGIFCPINGIGKSWLAGQFEYYFLANFIGALRVETGNKPTNTKELYNELAEVQDNINLICVDIKKKASSRLLAMLQDWEEQERALKEAIERANAKAGTDTMQQTISAIQFLDNAKPTQKEAARQKVKALIRTVVKRIEIDIQGGTSHARACHVAVSFHSGLVYKYFILVKNRVDIGSYSNNGTENPHLLNMILPATAL